MTIYLDSSTMFDAGEDRESWDQWRFATALAWALGPGEYTLKVRDGFWTLEQAGPSVENSAGGLDDHA